MTESLPALLPIMDRDSLPFWEGTRAGELRVQRCRGCGVYRWPARAICNRCRNFDAEWVVLSGHGKVVSWVTTHQVFARGVRDEVPYNTVLVQLAEQDDLQMIGRLTSESIAPRAGLEVEASFQPLSDAVTLVYWRPR
ncbi:MAG TPA: OB-fold domain-containing protein [Alphaproteobacteria bacterium]|nr:OB-fold domain-containing protein [Alphaproteobacteria bacterium]